MRSSAAAYTARLPFWVLGGAVAGTLFGLLVGESAAVLHPVGTIYADLMQVAVFPYLICALLHGLGRLSPETAWRLFRCSWLVYLAVWGGAFLVIFLLSIAIPETTPAFVDGTALGTGPGLLQMLIPTNPFFDLVRNYVPAIVVFSFFYGIAIQRIENKENFLNTLELIKKASVVFWRWIVLLAPLGVFALFAVTAGTVQLSELASLSIYLVTLLGGTFVLAFWILPALMSALCPCSTREILSELQGAIVIAVVTSLSVAALPFIQQATERLAERLGIEDEDRGEVVSTTLAVSYPLAQLGNFFIWLFILFAASYYRVPLDLGDRLALPFATLLSGIGSPSSSIGAVAFLAEWLALPSDATELYTGLLAVTRYGQVLASVMGFGFVTILATLNYYGRLRLSLPRLGAAVLGGLALVGLIGGAARLLEGEVGPPQPPHFLTYTLSAETVAGVTATIEKPRSASAGEPSARQDEAAPAATGDSTDTSILQRIRRTGELRFGYNPDIIPFSYMNEQGDLVGFDIAFAYRLAQDLNVKLRFIPFEWETLDRDLTAHRFDLAGAGIYVTSARLSAFQVSEPYFESPVALIVPAENAQEFLSRDAIEARTDLTVAVFDDPIMTALARQLFPGAKVVVVPNYFALPAHPEVDAAIWTLEQARVWASAYPAYTAVVPKDLGSPFLFAYLMPPSEGQFEQYLDYWLKLRATDGFRDRMRRKWLEGKPETKPEHWSILKNLLGW